MLLVYHFTAHQPHFFCSHFCHNQISADFFLLDAHVSCQLSLRNGKQMRGALTLPQIIALREFPDHSTGRGNWVTTQWLPWVEESELRLEELEFIGQNTRQRRGTQRDNPGDLQRMPSCIQQSASQACGNIPGYGKNHPKGLEGTVPPQGYLEFRKEFIAWSYIP